MPTNRIESSTQGMMWPPPRRHTLVASFSEISTERHVTSPAFSTMSHKVECGCSMNKLEKSCSSCCVDDFFIRGRPVSESCRLEGATNLGTFSPLFSNLLRNVKHFEVQQLQVGVHGIPRRPVGWRMHAHASCRKGFDFGTD